VKIYYHGPFRKNKFMSSKSLKSGKVISLFLSDRVTHVKALLWVQYGKNSMRACGRETNTAWGEVECCIGLKIHAWVLFFNIVRVWRCFNWFKAFLVDKFFVLTTSSDSKMLRTWLTVLYGKNSTVICLKFTHASTFLYVFTAWLFAWLNLSYLFVYSFNSCRTWVVPLST